MARISEYQKLYGLRNQATGKMILFYWASSQKHNALFSSKQYAEEAAIWVARDTGYSVMIVENS